MIFKNLRKSNFPADSAYGNIFVGIESVGEVRDDGQRIELNDVMKSVEFPVIGNCLTESDNKFNYMVKLVFGNDEDQFIEYHLESVSKRAKGNEKSKMINDELSDNEKLFLNEVAMEKMFDYFRDQNTTLMNVVRKMKENK